MSTNSLRILVAGGGIAGQALAFWLTRGGHRVTVAERFPALRASGAQVDLRGQGIEAIRRMGLLETVRDKLVDEAGVAFIDARGRAKATIMANTSGRGRQTLTSEYEIMRGDLVRILHDATKDDTTYLFDRSVDGFEQDAHRVVAQFSDGSTGEFDLLIAADGQGSRLRRALLPDGSDPYWRVGIHMAYWFVPRIASDSNIRDTYMVPGGRQIMRRSHNPAETQVYFVMREESAEASAIHRQPIEAQQEFWARRFRDAGWQTERFIDGMKDSPFFYSQEIAQVRIDSWSRGRAVLAGDAAHCASPYSGMGISGGLVGAYVLAGEINRHPGDLPTALANYETKLRLILVHALMSNHCSRTKRSGESVSGSSGSKFLLEQGRRRQAADGFAQPWPWRLIGWDANEATDHREPGSPILCSLGGRCDRETGRSRSCSPPVKSGGSSTLPEPYDGSK